MIQKFKHVLMIQNFLLALGFSVFAPLAQAQIPSTFEGVREWKSLGSSWALGFDKKHRPLAIFDLSYSDPQTRIFLACIDFKCANTLRVTELIEEQKRALGGPAHFATEATPDLEAFAQLEAEARSNPDNQKDSFLPKNWWKTVPWKKTGALSLLANSDAPPAQFRLSDIDFNELTGNQIQKFRKNLRHLLGKPEGLQHFEFVGDATGGYRLYWNPGTLGGGALPPAPPYKLADIRCPSCALAEHFTPELIENLVQELIGMIPVPVVSALLSTALGEWTHLRHEMTVFHQQRLLEMLAATDEGNSPSLPAAALAPFSEVSQEARNAAAAYIVYAQSSIRDVGRWLLQDPIDLWKKQEAAARIQADQTIDYLKRKGYSLRFLNSRNTLATNATQESWIFPLSTNRYWNIVPPFAAIDYPKPMRLVVERMSIEAAHVFVSILGRLIPIPGVGTVISQIYERIVHSQMHAVEHFEAMLDGHLHLRQEQGENWISEINSLRLQSANPLIPNYAESMARVKACREYYHLP